MPKPKAEEIELDPKASRKPSKKKFIEYIYNEDTGEIFGRTPQSWSKYFIIFIYIIFTTNILYFYYFFLTFYFIISILNKYLFIESFK